MAYPEEFFFSEEPKKGKLCYSFIPARVIFVIMGFTGFCLIYAYRVVLSVAIVAMVGQVNSTEESNDCHVDSNKTESHIINREFDWDSEQQAVILGAFFYGYVITQIPGGVLAQRFGAKWIFGVSILITALLSLLGPLAARWGFFAFFLTRFGQGLAEGVVWPCMNSLISKWMPKMERSRGTTAIFMGSQIGTVLSMSLAGYLCDKSFMGGWPAVFYLLGIIGCLWFLFWSAFVYESPEKHPHISEKEYDYIKEEQGDEQVNQVLEQYL
jgi:ACS family sodium-dependent inorganic phosphate cotransporter-like MFS transporter 5